LAFAAHPGVVGLIAGTAGGQAGGAGGSVLTRALRGRPLPTLADLSASEVARLGAAVATTLADLHEVGVIHHALSAEHIVVSPEGMATLCGFSRAVLVAGPAGRAGDGDVAALIEILAARLDGPGHAELHRRGAGLRGAGRSDSARRLAERLATYGCGPKALRHHRWAALYDLRRWVRSPPEPASAPAPGTGGEGAGPGRWPPPPWER